MNRAQLSAALRRIFDPHADHASLCALATRPAKDGVLVQWVDYLADERGPLVVIPFAAGARMSQDLVDEMQTWREEVVRRRERATERSVRPLARP